MKTNDKLPKENDYSLAYSSYNTQQDEKKDMEYSLYYNVLYGWRKRENYCCCLLSNWEVNEDEKGSEIQLLLPFNILPINYSVIKIVARITVRKTTDESHIRNALVFPVCRSVSYSIRNAHTSATSFVFM